MAYYIYKYVENDEVVYIGQTTELHTRIRTHTKDKLANFNGQIYYFSCPNKTAMDSWEYFLINKYHPKYNVALNDGNVSIHVDEPQWTLYEMPTIPVQAKQTKHQRPIEFHCYRCGNVFKTSKWDETPKGYSAVCTKCPYHIWVSKKTVQSQIKFEKLMKSLGIA